MFIFSGKTKIIENITLVHKEKVIRYKALSIDLITQILSDFAIPFKESFNAS